MKKFKSERGSAEVGAGILVAIAAVVVVVLLYAGYWFLVRDTTDRRYETDTHSQQYQSAVVAELRDVYGDFNRATNDGQKVALKERFCARVTELTQVPPDLATASIELSCPVG